VAAFQDGLDQLLPLRIEALTAGIGFEGNHIELPVEADHILDARISASSRRYMRPSPHLHLETDWNISHKYVTQYAKNA